MTPSVLLKELIAVPSVNPMGREFSGPEFLETRLTEYLVGYFRSLGVEHVQTQVAPGRSNVIARIGQRDDRPTILLDAHQDTVPVDGMTIEPFRPVEREGRIYGRGACDVKGGLACMLAAFARLANERPADMANVVIACTCDEESTILGVTDLVKLWSDPSRAGSILSDPPESAVVAEPTGLDIVVAHRGATRWRIRTTGRACHSSRPSEGINAIYRMAKVLRSLKKYAQHLEAMAEPHPLCGPATLSVGRIEGGVAVNTVPDECTIEVDRRVIPGEDGRGVIGEVREWLDRRLDFEVLFDAPWIIGEPLSDENNAALAERLLRHIEAVAGPRKKVGVAYGTHASRISASGVPAVVFGPGSIDQAHTKDEWIAIDQLEKAAEIYYRFCARH